VIFSRRGVPRKTNLAPAALVLLAAFHLLVAGCTASQVLTPVPESQTPDPVTGNFGDIRYWADEPPAQYVPREKKIIAKIHQLYGDSLRGKEFPVTYLCISGGGSNGAYGAGFLVGWTARGTRPQFNVVTGISTGSMIAPMAFLGPKYDHLVKEAYTTITTKDIATLQVLPALLGRTAGLADDAPLKKLIARYMTQAMLGEIAQESRKGRRLLIGTTNLENQRAMIWDIGAIAESGNPKALDLVRNVILASASIPGAFPPANISVTAGDKTYNEMHVDGGVTRQTFLYPLGYSPKVIDRAIGWKPKRTLYIIRNNKISPEYQVVESSVVAVTGRSIDTLIKSDGIADLFRIYAISRRDGIRYNYTSIPVDFNLRSKEAFDEAYMNALFDAGYNAALKSDPWKHVPPGF
jgi:Patatin-like phospholipase